MGHRHCCSSYGYIQGLHLPGFCYVSGGSNIGHSVQKLSGPYSRSKNMVVSSPLPRRLAYVRIYVFLLDLPLIFNLDGNFGQTNVSK